MDIAVATLILVAVIALLYRPLQRDLKHIRTATAPEPTWLDRAADRLLDGIDRAVSAAFRYFTARRK